MVEARWVTCDCVKVGDIYLTRGEAEAVAALVRPAPEVYIADLVRQQLTFHSKLKPEEPI